MAAMELGLAMALMVTTAALLARLRL